MGNDDKPPHANSGVSKNAKVSFNLPETRGSFPSAGSRLVRMLCVICVSSNIKIKKNDIPLVGVSKF